MSFIPGAGMKKPLNMLEQPIYPDIKQGPPLFKNSGKHWTVDIGQTVLDTEAHTQLYENAILAQSRDFSRDRYGHSSYEEKITVFRPPLQTFYEDHGPLNRLPTKIHAIVPRINPGTAHDGSGSSGYAANNQAIPEMGKYISDTISANSWRSTFFAPMDLPQDNSVLPDLVSTMPLYCASAGHQAQVMVDAPVDQLKLSSVKKPTVSASSGYSVAYEMPLSDQTSTDVTLESRHNPYSSSAGYHNQFTTAVDSGMEGMELQRTIPDVSYSAGHNSPWTKNGETRVDYILENNGPQVSASSGYTPLRTINGETRVDYNFESNGPQVSASSGYTPLRTIDGETRVDYQFDDNLPSTSVSAGHNSPWTTNGETSVDRIVFKSQLDAPLRVNSPGSEFGYHTRIDSLTTPEEHLKLRENPQVSATAMHVYDYKDRNVEKNNFFVRTKIEPVKSYGLGLGRGTILTAGVQTPQLSLKKDVMRRKVISY